MEIVNVVTTGICHDTSPPGVDDRQPVAPAKEFGVIEMSAAVTAVRLRAHTMQATQADAAKQTMR